MDLKTTLFPVTLEKAPQIFRRDRNTFVTENNLGIRIIYDPTGGPIAGLRFDVSGQMLAPFATGGLYIELGKREIFTHPYFLDSRVIETAIDENGLKVRFRLSDSDGVELEARLTAMDYLVLLSLSCTIPVCTRVTLARIVPGFLKEVKVPFLTTGREPFGLVGVIQGNGTARGWCLSAFFDWTVSEASSLTRREAWYHRDRKGQRNRLRELIIFSLAPNLESVLPELNQPKKSYLKELSRRVVLDSWCSGTLLGARSFIAESKIWRQLATYGLKDIIAISHVWQRGGYDRELPDVIPANPDLGGDPGLLSLGETAYDLGWLWALHENYQVADPNAHSICEEDWARTPKGQIQVNWYSKSTGCELWALSPQSAQRFASTWAPLIHSRYRTSAGFVDATVSGPPWQILDFGNERRESTATVVQSQKAWREVLDIVKKTHRGPLLAEGGAQVFWSGSIDGVTPFISEGDNLPLLVDFAIRRVNCIMVNHGMGYWDRWATLPSYNRRIKEDLLDKYRTACAAFGHSGFIGSHLLYHPLREAVKEYHMFRNLQERAYSGSPEEILYGCSEGLRPANEAILEGRLDRVKIKRDNGLSVWANLSNTLWTVDHLELPPFSFLAIAQDIYVGMKIVSGRKCDIAASCDELFVDTRYFPSEEARKVIDFGPISTDGAFYIQCLNDRIIITPIAIGDGWHICLKLNQLGYERPSSLCCKTQEGKRLMLREVERGDPEWRFDEPLISQTVIFASRYENRLPRFSV